MKEVASQIIEDWESSCFLYHLS